MKKKPQLVLVFYLLIFCLASSYSSVANNQIIISKDILFNGDNQQQTVNKEIINPIRVQVLSIDSTPIINHPVCFKFQHIPNKTKGHSISQEIAYTNNIGIAQTSVLLGSKDGQYYINAYSKNHPAQSINYSLKARKSNWLFILIIGMLGGLGLFLYGIHMMSNGMQKSAGDKMRTILGSLTNNRIIAVGVGSFVTMIIQSSSVTTVMLVSFVESRLMTFAQTLGVILGASIGTTITAQLIAFKLTDYSLLLIAIGSGILFFIKKEKIKFIGESVLGIGLLFFGMYIMSKSMTPIRSYEPILNLLIKLENPLAGIIVGTIFTALIQSSSAFIGIMIIFSSQGMLSLEASIPLILGANLGTAITAILASINTHREAKKVAFVHTLFKVFGILLFIWWIPGFVDFTKWLTSLYIENTSSSVLLPREIANAHTIFNVTITIIGLPLINSISKLINYIIPYKLENSISPFKTKFINKTHIQSPILSLNLAKEETIRMIRNVQYMVKDIIPVFTEKNTKLLNEIIIKEEKINFLRDQIKNYILNISRNEMSEKNMNEAFQILYTIKEFEQMADLISKILIKKAHNWSNLSHSFSDAGKKEIESYCIRSLKQISRSIEVFRDVNLEKAKNMKEKLKKYDDISLNIEKIHYKRLQAEVQKTINSSETHLEIINVLTSVNNHATNVAKILLEWQTKKMDNKNKIKN